MLARAAESRLDRLEAPAGFGALVVDAYRYDDEGRAYARLRASAQERQLILLSADDPLFRRVRASIAEFPRAEIIERPSEEPGAWLESDRPMRGYDGSPVRLVWEQLRQALDRRKVPTGVNDDTRSACGVGHNLIDFDIQTPATTNGPAPVLVATTFHPNWRREGGGEVYAATAFFMLTFADQTARLTFARTWVDRAGLYASALTLLSVVIFTAWGYRRVHKRGVSPG